MKIRFITVHFDGYEFESQVLEEFLLDKHVESMQQYFFQTRENPHVLFIIRYQDQHHEPLPMSPMKEKSQTKSWKSLLNEESMPLFEKLRSWRNERAKDAGIPSYVIGSNRVLALISNRRPTAISHLGEIEGVGKGTCEKYGEEILAIFNSTLEGEKDNE